MTCWAVRRSVGSTRSGPPGRKSEALRWATGLVEAFFSRHLSWSSQCEWSPSSPSIGATGQPWDY
eukprot:5195352-Pyramimonas_sp.AAC.1